MKKNLFLFSFYIFCQTFNNFVAGQILYSENFEVSPVTSILNSGESQLIDGPSPCGKATRGNTSVFNSAGIDFNSAQNAGYFVAVNPQTPCGGFYTANLATAPMDFSGQDSLKFSFRYFKSNTLLWGPATLSINVSNGITTHTISSALSVSGAWTDFETGLPLSLISANVTISVSIGGGEGVGLDDLVIENVGGTTPISNRQIEQAVKVFPSFFTESLIISTNHIKSEVIITDVNGRKVYHETMNGSETILASDWPAGMYFYEVINGGMCIQTGRLVHGY